MGEELGKMEWDKKEMGYERWNKTDEIGETKWEEMRERQNRRDNERD